MAELNIDSLSRLTVPELQQELKKRGLKKIGVKAKLIQRLSEYLIKYGTEIIMVTPQNQPNCSINENLEPVEESGIENDLSEEIDSSHVIEELANSIHRSQDCQDNGTRRVNIDSEELNEGVNNETVERLADLENQEDGGWNQESIYCDKESSITNVLHTSKEHSGEPKVYNTEEIDQVIDNTEAHNTNPSQEFQYEEDSIEVDPKLFIEENQDSSKVADNQFQNQKMEEITQETLIDEGEIVSEDDEENVKKLKQKTVKPVPLKKRVSLQGSVESVEEKAAKRKRRWGSTSKSTLDQNSESIKKVITEDKNTTLLLDDQPELDYQEEDDRDAGTSNRRKVKVEAGKIISLGKRTNPDILIVEDAGESVPKSVDIIFSKPIYVDEDSEMQGKRDRSPSPARNPVSCYIHITGLVRPFTVNQLKVLIGRTGTISENGFWINQVKSHCYVQLSSEEQAAETRNALHGLKWPSGTPKVLKVDFALNTQIWEDTQGVMGGKPKIVIEIEDKNENKSEEIVEDKKAKKQKEVEKKDRTKESKRKDTANRKDKKREESPAKLLDDLFRKTKATPCIYWLPLTDEQILNREKKNLIEQNENINTTKITTNKENTTSRRSRSLNRPVRGRR